MFKTENLIYLINKQTLLDEYIMKSKQLVVNSEIRKKKIIALLVEISEFINEFRSFKFWSNKKASEREVLLEEYIDGLHFILSLGIDLKFDFQTFESNSFIDIKNIDDWSIAVYKRTIEFEQSLDLASYSSMLKVFLQVICILKISDEELLEIYNKKNEENFNRQNCGY